MQLQSREPLQQIMLARYYSDSLGRFLSADPEEPWDEAEPQTWNLYSYVANNPLRFLDPGGLEMVEHSEMNIWMESKVAIGFREARFDGYMSFDPSQLDDMSLESFDDVEVGVHEIVDFAQGSPVDGIVKSHEFKHRDLFREAMGEQGLKDFDKQLTQSAKRIIDKGKRKGWSEGKIRQEIKKEWRKQVGKADKKLKKSAEKKHKKLDKKESHRKDLDGSYCQGQPVC